MDSSDDDKPIAALMAAKSAQLNIPKQTVRTAPGPAKSANALDSDDDDVPLAVLMKRKLDAMQKKPTVPSNIIKTAPPVKKVKTEDGCKNPSRKVNDKKSKAKSKVKLSKSKSGRASAASSQTSSKTSVYYESDKGRLVQALMVRWWYAIQWPETETATTSPPGYEALNGFPGVFVGTRLDNFGDIKDVRNKSTCPNFKNLWAKSSEELKVLCEKAIREQIKALVDAEGADTALERTLVRELKQIQGVNAATADKRAPR